MTHKELLAKIDGATGLLGTDKSMILTLLDQSKALHAVVELHKPKEDGYCDACFVSVVHLPYPCPTIQAIEKELS